MAGSLAGFPFWTVHFDEQGQMVRPGVIDFLKELVAPNLTDLFVFSHGWNNDEATAMQLYSRFFGQVEEIISDASVPKRSGLQMGVLGVLWPSILFPGDTAVPMSGGGASFSASQQSSGTLASELPKVFSKPQQQEDLQLLLLLIQNQEPENDALFQFRDTLASMLRKSGEQDTTAAGQDNLEFRAVTDNSNDDWMRMLDIFSVQPAGDGSEGGATDFGNPFGRLWNASKNLLRVATYWQMKNRAGVVGKLGLGPLLGSIHERVPALKIHLLGHSFGARLVSYALAGIPDSALAPVSPVKSLFLIQGAFSHFAFADVLPFDAQRSGDLTRMSARVDGPLLTTHSLKDLAVGSAYPAASIIARQDASDATDLMYRWEGMGHDGAQAVNAASAPLGDLASSYPFETGKWINLDGNQVIVNGGPPSGAHSDIVHPEIAWAAVSAAKVVQATT